jgi:hypothetical protein
MTGILLVLVVLPILRWIFRTLFPKTTERRRDRACALAWERKECGDSGLHLPGYWRRHQLSATNPWRPPRTCEEFNEELDRAARLRRDDVAQDRKAEAAARTQEIMDQYTAEHAAALAESEASTNLLDQYLNAAADRLFDG